MSGCFEISEEVFVNSNYRAFPENSTSTSFNFQYVMDELQRPISTYTHVCVLQAVIPHSYYGIGADARSFTITENGVPRTLSLSAANYTNTTFTAGVLALLNGTGGGQTPPPGGWVYTMTDVYNAWQGDPGKWQFTVSGNGGNQPFFTWTGLDMARNFGFNQNSVSTFVANYLQSTNVYSLQRTTMALLHSTMSNDNDQILEEIPMSQTRDYDVSVFTQIDIESNAKELIAQNSELFRFYLTDTDDRLLDLNGIPLVFSVIFFRKNTTDDLHAEVLKTQLRNPLSIERR